MFLILVFSFVLKIMLFTNCIDCSHVYIGGKVIYLIGVICVKVGKGLVEAKILASLPAGPSLLSKTCLAKNPISEHY